MAGKRSVRGVGHISVASRGFNSDALGRQGENQFSKLCIVAGLYENKAGLDRTGWDYIVEFPFPSEPESHSLDARPSPPEARVQIKATASASQFLKIRLSAAERLAKHPQASFICVFVLGKDGEFEDLYVLHIIGDLLSDILHELRRCEAKNGLQVNKKFITIQYRKYADRVGVSGHALRMEFEKAFGSDLERYIGAKAEQRRSLGYGEFRFEGSFSIKANSPSEATSIMLGMSKGVVKDFKVKEVRWGIPLPRPELDSVVEVEFQPKPKNGEIVFRDISGVNTLRLKVEVYFASVVCEGVQHRSIRLSNSIVEMVVDVDQERVQLTNSKVGPLSIQQHIKLNNLRKILLSNNGKFDIRVEGRNLIKTVFDLEDSNLKQDQLLYTDRLLSMLNRILHECEAQNISLEVSEINDQTGMITFLHELLTEPRGELAVSLDVVANENFPSDLVAVEVLLLGSLIFGSQVIQFGAVGNAVVLGDREIKTIEASSLSIREIAIADFNADQTEQFRVQMSAETGLSFIISVGAGLVENDAVIVS